MNRDLEPILHQVEQVITGKEDVITSILTALLAGGHVLLDDVPGVGKTTLAVALSRALGLRYRRVQFTPDVLPSDIVGFSIYDRDSGSFRYVPGAAVGVNLLLGDEINRTAAKTQSALLEAMEEGQVTVDGAVHPLEDPFWVIATENQVGAEGTQSLPHAQMDRFLVRLTVGYPDYAAQMELIRDRQTSDPLDRVEQVSDITRVKAMQEAIRQVTLREELLDYITRLAMASREHELLSLGISPRGALWLSRMAKARAWAEGRDFTLPEDVQAVFTPVCAHRVLLSRTARAQGLDAPAVMSLLLEEVKLPHSLV